MYEIKKIFPVSLAKYSAIITAIIILILGVINFILNLSGIGIQYNIPWDQQLTNLFASVIFFAIFFWVVGYIFAVIYNAITYKSKGVLIEFKLADKRLLEEIEKKEIKNDNSRVLNNSLEKNKDEKKDKFVV